MLLFCDSFDHYASADFTQKWSSSNGGATIQSGQGRRGTNSLRATASNSNYDKTVTAVATGIVGFAFKTVGGLPGSAGNFLEFRDSGTLHVALRLNTDGTISAMRSTTVLGTSASAISDATYNHLEVKVTISDTVGVVEVRINGTNSGWLNLTNQDTRNAGNLSFNTIRLNGVSATDIDYDDFHYCDTTGSVNNDFLGDSRVDAYYANGNGNSSQLDGSDGNSVDNYLLVDETLQDGDTTYVESSTAAEKDTYAFGNMSHTPSIIHGVQVVANAKKDDAGARSITTVVRSDGADYDGATVALTTAYLMYYDIHEEDPDTSAAWTKSGFDAAEFGVKVAA